MGIIMRFLAVLFLLFSTNLLAQDVVTDLDQIESSSSASRVSAQYSFTKRTLDQTDFMVSNRAQRIAADGAYISPREIRFDLHTFGLRYEANRDLAFEAAGSYMKSAVDLTGQTVTGVIPGRRGPPTILYGAYSNTVGSQGMGDSRVGVIYKALRRGNHTVTTSGHLNIPTGSVEEQEDGYIFPYAGQLGSGTYDLLPEIKYNYRETGFVAGTKVNYTLRTGRNKSDYRMGNQALFDSFVGYDYKKMVGVFLKGRIRDWKASSDPRYEVAAPRIDDPYVQKGRRWEVLATARTGLPLPWNLGAVIVEGGVPVYQDQKAGEVQLETAWYLTSRVVASF